MLGRSTVKSLRHATKISSQMRFVGGLVPVVLESSALGERSFDIFSRLLRERIICGKSIQSLFGFHF
jgi:ATP-dependent Clp protease protease subunit